MTVAEFFAWTPPKARAWQLVDGEPQAMAPASRTDGAIQASRRRQEEERHDALSHVPGRFKLTKALTGRKPIFGNQAQDDPACARRSAQSLAPFVAARYAVMMKISVKPLALSHASSALAKGSSLLE